MIDAVGDCARRAIDNRRGACYQPKPVNNIRIGGHRPRLAIERVVPIREYRCSIASQPNNHRLFDLP